MHLKAQQALFSCFLAILYQRSHTSNLNMLDTAFIPFLQASPVQTSTTVTKASSRSLGLLLFGDSLIFCFVVDTALVSGLSWPVLCGGQTGFGFLPHLPSTTGITGVHHHSWHGEVSPNPYFFLLPCRIPIYLHDCNPVR